MFKVSFIIPCYNSFLTIQKTVESVLNQNAFDQIQEVIIVDSSDDSKTVEYLNGIKHPKVTVIHLNQKTPPAQGRNIGAKHASGELLCFIDSDVVLDPSWLNTILAAYSKGCKAGCGSVNIPDYQKDNSLALAQLYLQFNESLDVGTTRSVSMVPACNMFVDRKLFIEAGGFPEIRASEDVLLCLKIGETEKVWFVPEARCFHMFREDKGAYHRNQIILGKYIIIYRRMKYDKWFYKGVFPLFLLPAFALIKMARIKLRIYKAGWKHTLKFWQSTPQFLIGFWFWCVGFAQGVFLNE